MEWVEKKLIDVVDSSCSLSYGIVQPGKDFSNGLPVVRPTDLTQKVIQTSGLKRINPELAESYKRTSLSGGELLLCVRGSTGTVSIAAEELAGANVTRGIVPIRFDPSVICREFGYYALISGAVQNQIKEGTYGAALMQINIRDLKNITVAYPQLSEQKRIVAILDEAFAGIDAAVANTEKNLANARELFESYLNAFFTQKGDGWVEKTLEDVCDLISGQHIDAKNYNTDQKGIGYLTGPADFGVINPTASKWTEFPKRTALRGDILITVKGSGVGKINLLNHEELAISRQLMAVRAKGAKTEFLYEFLSLQFSYFQSLANGAAIPGISRSDVLNLKLSVPELSEQERIVAAIDEYKAQTKRLEAIYQQKLDALAELKQSILQKAFAGELSSLPEQQIEEAVA